MFLFSGSKCICLMEVILDYVDYTSISQTSKCIFIVKLAQLSNLCLSWNEKWKNNFQEEILYLKTAFDVAHILQFALAIFFFFNH